jgi:hypothetical protein
VKQPDTTTPAEPIKEEASPPPEERTEVMFPFGAGRLVRDDAIFQLRLLAMHCGVQIEVAENRGWIESAFMIRVSGIRSGVQRFCDSFNAWTRQLRASGFC